jgi:hypothetical protein
MSDRFSEQPRTGKPLNGLKKHQSKCFERARFVD